MWERDRGICHVCSQAIHVDEYWCGHIVDRCVGGSDDASNLVVQCALCNYHKPVHETPEQYQEWVTAVHEMLDGGRTILEALILAPQGE